MNGKQLRASILQEAIAGRLVPQNPNDEPASELLHRINPKATPLETEQPLPQGWVWCKPSDLGTFGMGKTILRKDLSSEGIPVYSATMGDEPFGWIKKEDNKLKLTKGDLVIPARGVSVGYVKLVKDEEATSTQTTIYVKVRNKEFSPFLCYYYHACRTTIFKSTGTSIPQVTIEMLFRHPIPLPPLAEQKRIVAKIEELMPLVDEYEKAQEEFDNLNAGLKGKLRASLLQEAIAGRLVPQDPSDEPASELLHRINPKATPLETEQPLPQGWCATTLSDICTTINGLWKGKKGPFVNVGVIRNANFTKDFKLDYSKIQYLDVEQKSFAKRKLLDGDLIVEKSGGGDKTPVGRAILYEGENGIYSFSNFTMLLRIRNKAEILPKYIYYFLLAKYRSGAMVGMQTHTTGLRNLETDKYLSMPVPLPPLSEQKRIVEKLESLFAVLDNLDKLTA